MERKSFIWALDALLGGQSIQVLESYLIRGGKCVARCGTDARGKYRLTPLDEDALDTLSKVYREHQLLYRLRQTGPNPCYFFIGETRVHVSVDKLEEYLKSESLPSDLQLVQIPQPSVAPAEYSLKALLRGSEYSFALFLHEAQGKKEIKSASRLRAFSQVAKTALNSLRGSHTVVSATFEFTTDEHQGCWLSHIDKCLVDTSSTRSSSNVHKTPKAMRPQAKALNSSHKARLGTSLRKDVSGSRSKLQVTSRSKKGQGAKRAKPGGPALSCNRTIASATLSLLQLPVKTGKLSKH